MQQKENKNINNITKIIEHLTYVKFEIDAITFSINTHHYMLQKNFDSHALHKQGMF